MSKQYEYWRGECVLLAVGQPGKVQPVTSANIQPPCPSPFISIPRNNPSLLTNPTSALLQGCPIGKRKLPSALRTGQVNPSTAINLLPPSPTHSKAVSAYGWPQASPTRETGKAVWLWPASLDKRKWEKITNQVKLAWHQHNFSPKYLP